MIYAPQTAATPRHPRLLHLQILRAVAASLVVAAHTDSLARELGYDLSPYSHACEISGLLGVAAFFVLSGFIMFQQADEDFQTPGSPLRFMARRIIRIVPMYWLATLLVLATRTYRDVGNLPQRILLALFFIPDYHNIIFRPQPLLGPGWTLDYEMAFYLLVALALFLPQRRGTIVLVAVPFILTSIGTHLHFPLTGFIPTLLNVYTANVVRLFAVGVIIALCQRYWTTRPTLHPILSPAWLLVVPAALFFVAPFRLGSGFHAWNLLTVFAILVVLLCTLASNPAPGALTRALVLCGDASYSTYLFHTFLFLLIRLVHPADLHPQLSNQLSTHTLFFATMIPSLIAANLLGILIHLTIERPLTRALHRIPISSVPHSSRPLR